MPAMRCRLSCRASESRQERCSERIVLEGKWRGVPGDWQGLWPIGFGFHSKQIKGNPLQGVRQWHNWVSLQDACLGIPGRVMDQSGRTIGVGEKNQFAALCLGRFLPMACLRKEGLDLGVAWVMVCCGEVKYHWGRTDRSGDRLWGVG